MRKGAFLGVHIPVVLFEGKGSFGPMRWSGAAGMVLDVVGTF